MKKAKSKKKRRSPGPSPTRNLGVGRTDDPALYRRRHLQARTIEKQLAENGLASIRVADESDADQLAAAFGQYVVRVQSAGEGWRVTVIADDDAVLVV